VSNYTIKKSSCLVRSNSLICDANLLIARFKSSGDHLRTEAEYVLDKDYDLLLPISSLIEAFHACKPSVNDLFEWILAPNRVEILPEDTTLTEEGMKMHRQFPRLDLVDCLLLVYAKSIANTCGWTKPIPIVTGDQPLMGIARGFSSSYCFLDLNYPDNGVQ